MNHRFDKLRRTLVVLGPDRRWRWWLLVVLALFVAAFEALGAVLILTLLELIAEPSDGLQVPAFGDLGERFPGMDDRTLLLGVAGAVAAFFVIRGGVLVATAYIQGRLVQSAAAQLSAHLVRGYLALPYIFHTQRNSAELVRNTFDSVTALTSQVVMPMVKVVAESLLVVGMVVVLLWASPLATLLAIAVLGPLILVLIRIVHPRLKRLGRRSQAAKEGSLKAVQQALGGVRDIKILGRGRFFSEVFSKQRRELARTTYLHQTIGQLPRALIETSLVLIIVLLLTAAILGGGSVQGTLSTLGVFAYAGLRLQPSLRDIVKGVNDIRFGGAVLDDLSSDRARVDEALALERASRSLSVPPTGFNAGLNFDSVAFRYGAQGIPALRDVDLDIRRGEFVGICGPTGGGKSTLVDLMVGLLQPSEGTIYVDGHDLADVTSWWQQQIGLVSQSVFLLDDTVRANIALGEGDEVDESRLERAVRRAQLADVVKDLPQGIDTVVGERGIRLSGGQRQRVAIARALYREPSLLVLDEGTSALDSATEANLVAAIDEVREGRTLIAVAHRLSTVRAADRILVVEAGRIAAAGTYDQLIDRSDLFRSLAT